MEIRVKERIDEEFGANVLNFSLWDGDTKIGYVDVSWITYKRWENKYPNIWEYLFWVEKWPCWSKLPGNYDLLTEDQIFEMAKLRNGKIVDQSGVRNMEESAWETYGDKYDEFRDRFVQRPYVEYVWVDPRFRNNGHAKELYFYAAEHLWEKYELELRSGETQTLDGERLWESIERLDNSKVEIDGKQKILKRVDLS